MALPVFISNFNPFVNSRIFTFSTSEAWKPKGFQIAYLIQSPQTRGGIAGEMAWTAARSPCWALIKVASTTAAFGEKLNLKYFLVQKLGWGQHSSVWLVKDDPGVYVATWICLFFIVLNSNSTLLQTYATICINQDTFSTFYADAESDCWWAWYGACESQRQSQPTVEADTSWPSLQFWIKGHADAIFV